MNDKHSEGISRLLAGRMRQRALRLGAGILVWGALLSLETGSSAVAQDGSCCQTTATGTCAMNLPQAECLALVPKPDLFEATGHQCLRGRCCPLDAPRVCGRVCCKPGEIQCDAQNKCCKPTARFQITAVRGGPPPQMDITVHNPENGIGRIIYTQLVNATMYMPSYTPGTRDPVVCTMTKINPNLPAQVELAACTTDGCCQNGDPILTVLRIAQGRARVRESFSGIPAAEHFVSVQNGSPGLQRLHVFVNGRRVRVLALAEEEERTIDIAAHMAPQNIITLVGQGAGGSSGLVYVADVPGLSKATGMPYHVEWDPGFLPEEVDMHWGK